MTDMPGRERTDKLAIQELIYRYSDAVTRGDLDAMAAVFADHAIWESPALGMHFDSARAFLDDFAAATAPTELLVQTASNPVVHLVDADRARATTTIFELYRSTAEKDGPFGPKGAEINFSDYGIYYDDVERFDGEWRFAHRVFVPCYLETGAARGDVPVPRSALRAPPNG